MENTRVFIESKHSEALRRSEELYYNELDTITMLKATASSAERTLRYENRKALTTMCADNEAEILNLTVAHQ
eukprot:1641726-Heterocapsa_arctica.AAC.1